MGDNEEKKEIDEVFNLLKLVNFLRLKILLE